MSALIALQCNKQIQTLQKSPIHFNILNVIRINVYVCLHKQAITRVSITASKQEEMKRLVHNFVSFLSFDGVNAETQTRRNIAKGETKTYPLYLL